MERRTHRILVLVALTLFGVLAFLAALVSSERTVGGGGARHTGPRGQSEGAGESNPERLSAARSSATERVPALDLDNDASNTRILGRVIEVDGRPVPRARVLARGGEHSTADDQGEFALEGLRPGEHWLHAEAPGCAARPSPPVRVGPGLEERDVLLVLEPALALAGHVRDVDGRPIAGALLEVEGIDENAAFGRVATTSGDDGSFRLSPLPSGRVQLVAQHPAHLPFGRIYDGEDEQLDLVLHAAAAISGRIVAQADDAPLALERVTVLASADEEQGPWKRLGEPLAVGAEEGAQGRFQVRVPPQRWLRIVVEGPGFAPAASAAVRVDAGKTLAPLVLRASNGTSVACRALDELGRPLAGAELRVLEVPGASALVQAGAPFERRRVLSGSDGIARSLPLAPGRYRLELRRAGHSVGQVEELEVGATQAERVLDVVLARAASLRGRVQAARAGAAPRLRVLAWRAAAGEPARAELVDGAFELAPLAPGEYSVEIVEAQAEEHVRSRIELSLAPGEERQLVLDLETLGGDVFGVYTRDGEPLPLASVSLCRAARKATWSCKTDRLGRFRFSGVAAGEYLLAADTDASGDCRALLAVQVAGAGEQRVDFEIRTGALAGRLLAEDGAPLVRASVRVEQVVAGAPQLVVDAQTDADGRFDLAYVPAGAFLLHTDVPLRKNVRELACRVTPGSRTLLDDLHLPATGSLVLHLQRRPGMAVPSATVVAARGPDPAGLVLERSFAAGERPRLAELPAGPLELEVRTADGFVAEARASVAAGETRTVVVTF